MEQEEANRIIHKAMGKCWHDWHSINVDNHARGWTYQCLECDRIDECGTDNPDYSLWPHYGPMLEWVVKQEWFDSWMGGKDGVSVDDIKKILLNPATGSAFLASYIEENVKEGG